jgi:hypothetical protein
LLVTVKDGTCGRKSYGFGGLSAMTTLLLEVTTVPLI